MFNSDLTKHLAELSKIEFTDDEVEYKDLRADEHRNSYPTEDIVKNAKNVKNNSFVVPTVVEQSRERI